MGEAQKKAEAAKKAAVSLARYSGTKKVMALIDVASAIEDARNCDRVLEANRHDVEAAHQAGAADAVIDRLTLDSARLSAIADAVRQVASLEDPIGEIVEGWTLPNGIQLQKVRVPLGVVGVIYESRPNVTVDAFALCFKTSNAVVLRGSSSALETNKALVFCIKEALKRSDVDPEVIQLIEHPSHAAAKELMTLRGLVDLLIPRGSQALIDEVVENSSVPVIETGAGNCHLYVDAHADLDKALAIAINSKVQRPYVCNAAETLLVHEAVADSFLPLVLQDLVLRGVEIRGDERVRAVAIEAGVECAAATDEDWATEYLDKVLAVRVVSSLDEAIEHINRWNTKHTEAIITEHLPTARRFCAEVDAAVTMVNASTRFTDGGEFGFGAEIGISTQKLHARGPMGLRELTSTKFVLLGDGQTRE
ncbi:MAG: glutamate-5-semialdehyde dehydrogenase [Acidimicrobiia bacterium]